MENGTVAIGDKAPDFSVAAINKDGQLALTAR